MEQSQFTEQQENQTIDPIMLEPVTKMGIACKVCGNVKFADKKALLHFMEMMPNFMHVCSEECALTLRYQAIPYLSLCLDIMDDHGNPIDSTIS